MSEQIHLHSIKGSAGEPRHMPVSTVTKCSCQGNISETLEDTIIKLYAINVPALLQ